MMNNCQVHLAVFDIIKKSSRQEHNETSQPLRAIILSLTDFNLHLLKTNNTTGSVSCVETIFTCEQKHGLQLVTDQVEEQRIVWCWCTVEGKLNEKGKRCRQLWHSCWCADVCLATASLHNWCQSNKFLNDSRWDDGPRGGGKKILQSAFCTLTF